MESLRAKGWSLADSQRHPLGSLQGRALGSYELVILIGPKNRIGASYFQALLQNARGEVSHQPIVIGLHNQGRYPGHNWIEIICSLSQVSLGPAERPLTIRTSRLTKQLFQYLADLIPPGGHMMIEYDSPEQRDTACSLALGIPPIATPTGYMLFSIGCGTGFKDWYFAEGGSEGPRKLQGYKMLNSEHAQLRNKEIIRELRAFLDRVPAGQASELERTAKDRALSILRKLTRSRRKK
jgi:hypothetical protein